MECRVEKMKENLQEISIRGLHNQMDITIPVSDNRFVLVGVNGLGKTTVVNILYFFLSQQWHLLSGFRFSEIEISIGRKKLRVTYDMVVPTKQIIRRFTTILPPSFRKRIANEPKFISYIARGEYQRAEKELGLPSEFIERRLGKAHDVHWQRSLFDEDEPAPLAKIGKGIEELISSQILYLPTYRRIEQDLNALLPHFDEDIKKAISKQLYMQRQERAFVELVQFGMEDVQNRISIKISQLKEQARVELSELAGSYLRDVISGDAERYKRQEIASLDEDEVDRILGRVEEKTLPDIDKRRLREVIRGIRSEANQEEESSQERYLAHFFSKLVEMYRSQQKRETPLREFVRVCNQYLEGKQIEFIDTEYSLAFRTEHGAELDMGRLSSGEKQIVSLFSHIYLSEANSFFIIIDEPELSLSVDWQKRLLPDLMSSERCAFLAAVTHSPFIFDNEFEKNAIDLGTCMTLR